MNHTRLRDVKIGETTVKYFQIVLQVGIIYLITKAGEWVQSQFNLPIPGSIVGLFLLLILLSCKAIPEKWIREGANFLLSTMMLFFIPATVGIMNYFDIFRGRGWLLVLGIIVSACIVMIFSGFVAEKGLALEKIRKTKTQAKKGKYFA